MSSPSLDKITSNADKTVALLKAFEDLRNYANYGRYYNGSMWVDFPGFDGKKIKEDFQKAAKECLHT